MRRLVAITFYLIAMTLLTLAASAQSGRIDGGVATRKTFSFHWETRVEPPGPVADNFTSITNEQTRADETIYRVVGDRSRRVFVGYAANVEVLPEPNTYRMTLRQLDADVAKSMFAEFGNWTALPTPRWGTAVPQTIHGGDVLAVDLLVNGTGQKIVDYVTIQEVRRQGFEVTTQTRDFAFATGTARDFRAEDAEMRIRDPRLSINGKLEQSTEKYVDTVEGPVIWFYAGKRGRFILSLLPRRELGFRKAGEVRGSSLTFKVGNDTFSLVSGELIASRQGVFNLYILHQPSWRPTYEHADLDAFIMDAADRPEWLLRK